MKRLVHRIWKKAVKEGWPMPDWLEERMVFRTVGLLLGGGILCLALAIVSFFGNENTVTRLERPSYGEGFHQEELELEWRKENGDKAKKEMTIRIGEKEITDKEARRFFGEVKEKIGTLMLGKNRSADEIRYPLCLPEKLDDCPVTISWSSSDPSVMDWEGKPGRKIPEEGVILRMTADLTIQDKTDTYVQYIKVYPPILTEEEKLKDLLEEADEDRQEAWIRLPETITGGTLIWKKPQTQSWIGLFLLVLWIPILLLLRDRQAKEEKKKEERIQMMQDYPEIVTKLTLLLTTGVSMRKSMDRVAADYISYKKADGERRAYEVIVQICQEMERGISEREAYERMGERCGILPYRTLAALLVQHLQKGNRGMESMMEAEAQKAQEIRQQQARILGEQASAKLLVPMILMLIVVFLILLVPAWFAFGI